MVNIYIYIIYGYYMDPMGKDVQLRFRGGVQQFDVPVAFQVRAKLTEQVRFGWRCEVERKRLEVVETNGGLVFWFLKGLGAAKMVVNPIYK